MATIYVDPLNGTDNGDAGRGETQGTSAYASVAYALANYGSFSSTAANTIYLADTAADVLSAPLDFDTSVASVEAPLALVGYHYDGSNGGTAGALTVNLPKGKTVSGGEIDGNDAVASFCDSGTRYVTCYNLKIHSTTSIVARFNDNCSLINCEIYNGSLYIVTGGRFGVIYNCKIHNDVASGVTGIFSISNVIGNEIYGVQTGIFVTQPQPILGNTIYDVTDIGIKIQVYYPYVVGNTVDGSGGGTSAKGIAESISGFVEGSIIVDNIVSNFSGASQKGIAFASGAAPNVIGNNAFYNNTTDSDTPAGALVFGDITESTDPFTDSSTGDFSLVSGANSIGAAMFRNSDPDNPDNIGAWQDYSSGGGGGSGGRARAFSY